MKNGYLYISHSDHPVVLYGTTIDDINTKVREDFDGNTGTFYEFVGESLIELDEEECYNITQLTERMG